MKVILRMKGDVEVWLWRKEEGKPPDMDLGGLENAILDVAKRHRLKVTHLEFRMVEE